MDNPLLSQDVVQRAVNQMAEINSVESFQSFYDRYQCCSEIQRQQIIGAFTAQVAIEQQFRFYECWQQLEALKMSVEPVQQPQLIQKPVKPAGRNKWVLARLKEGMETAVKVVSETSVLLLFTFLGWVKERFHSQM
ncbi:hypothetical protein HC928_07595 [bacterium]|nr:hypothetical protein [bacterium]